MKKMKRHMLQFLAAAVDVVLLTTMAARED